MYTSQTLRVKWGHTVSNYFTVRNGVKQGDVLSPLLFAIYTDSLLIRLEKSGVGCHMGGHFTGSLAYADYITLLFPSILFGHMIPYMYSMKSKQFINFFIFSNFSVQTINLPCIVSVVSIIYTKNSINWEQRRRKWGGEEGRRPPNIKSGGAKVCFRPPQ